MEMSLAEATVQQDVRFSYSSKSQPLAKRSIIQLIEKLGGQRRLKALYDIYRSQGVEEDFFCAAVRLLDLDVVYDPARLAKVPRSGPVLFIANHPFGVLDGLLLTWLAKRIRSDVKVLAHSLLCHVPEAAGHLLPINFEETREARDETLRSRIEAQAWLKAGHAIGIFPGGGVSFSRSVMRGPAVDLAWAPFTARLARMERCNIVPVHFSGQNSRLFQMVSHVSMTLRTALLFHETARLIGKSVEVRIGEPIQARDLQALPGREEVLTMLRRKTYALASSHDGSLPAPEIFMRPTVLTIDKRGRKAAEQQDIRTVRQLVRQVPISHRAQGSLLHPARAEFRPGHSGTRKVRRKCS
jgi:putative hemolysin